MHHPPPPVPAVAAALAFMLPVAAPLNAVALWCGFIKVHEMVRECPVVCALSSEAVLVEESCM